MRLPDVRSTLDFSQKLELRRRLESLREAYTTTLILDEAQADPVLDLAAHTGLYAIVELAVDPEDILNRDRGHETLSNITHTVNIWRDHPALVGYLLDCPVAPDLLKEIGIDRLKRALRKVIREIRIRCGRALVAIKHRPATMALAMEDEDFLYAAVGGLTPTELTRFAIPLHNLAMARPVVVEFADTAAGQDELVAAAFGVGAAGVVAAPVQRRSAGWFGVRMASAEEVAPFVSLNGTCPPVMPRTRMVSVVVCAYNAERTMRPCLESLHQLKYPNYEVIIVDDGSRDRTAQIAMEFPQFRLIRQPNRGLSVARNVGLHAARGEIVAYTDSDCVVDPDWLTLMSRAMTEGGFDGCGGPNYAPHEEGRVEGCVAASPGAPCHVLVADDRAEHLAGCNMMFSKAALVAIGGFDPQFTSAGDDVDICWRMLEAGMNLGYCPAAFVWHFRRNTVKAYYGQQRGYGRAEAMLYSKYPERFNMLGQIRWQGTIPGLAATVPGALRHRIGWTRTTDSWQTVHEQVPGILSFLPQTLEWNIVWASVAIFAWAGGFTVLPALAMLALSPIWALHYAWRAPLEKCHDSLGSRLFVGLLAYTGPMTRTWTRWKVLMRAGKIDGESGPRQRPSLRPLRRSLHLSYWNDTGTTRENLLERIARTFSRGGIASVTDAGWNDFDLDVRPDPWTRIEFKTADEEHEGGRLKTHVAARVRLSALSKLGTAGALAALAVSFAAHSPALSAVLAALVAAGLLCAIGEAVESGRVAYHVTEQCARELGLIALGRPTAAARREAAKERRQASSARGFANKRPATD